MTSCSGWPTARKLRAELPRQVKRMLEDKRGRALTENFVGQWLEVRDLDGIFFNERAILRREGIRLRGADTERNVLTRDIRRAMRSETELAFEYVVRENRSVLEWIDSDYTFLNERLAKYYKIPGVEGSEMRRVTLPKDSPRGGVLDAWDRPGGDLEPVADLAGEARSVHPR